MLVIDECEITDFQGKFRKKTDQKFRFRPNTGTSSPSSAMMPINPKNRETTTMVVGSDLPHKHRCTPCTAPSPSASHTRATIFQRKA